MGKMTKRFLLIAAMLMAGSVFADQAAAPSVRPFTIRSLLPTQTDVGLLLGYTASNRAARLNSTVFTAIPPVSSSVAGNNLQQNGDAGLQLKLAYSFRKIQPFMYLNVASVFGSSNTINMGIPNSAATGLSQIIMSYEWLARVGLGLQTAPFFGQWQLGVGAGGALVNQKLRALVADSGLNNQFLGHLTRITPTMMGFVTWQACQSCIAAHPLSLSFQMSVDRNPSFGANGTSSVGNTYTANIGAKWIPHGDIVFNIPWF